MYKKAASMLEAALLAGAEGLEPSTKVLETHVWRACRPPGTEFHITPLNWPFKSDFQSRMSIIAEFLHLTRGNNKGPKDPRGISWLFACHHKAQRKNSAHRLTRCELMGVAIYSNILITQYISAASMRSHYSALVSEK